MPTPPKIPAASPVTDDQMKARLIREPKLPFVDEPAGKSLGGETEKKHGCRFYNGLIITHDFRYPPKKL